jgi:hypothetical protein
MSVTVWATLIGVGAAALLLVAGYLVGLGRGRRVRDALRHRIDARDRGIRAQLQEVTRSLQHHEATQQMLESDLKRYLDRLGETSGDNGQIGAELRTILAPVIERDHDDRALRGAIREIIGPLVQREQLGHDLAHLDAGSGGRGELPRLLDDIAIKGGFSTVLLSDDAGLPLAASHRAHGIDRLAGLCSLVMLLVDRLSREDAPAPLAVVVHDEANHEILSRVFFVAGQQLLLTVVASGANLTPTALDPALSKIEAVLDPVDA